LENAPTEDPDDSFLEKLQEMKNSMLLSVLDSSEEVSAGQDEDLLSWLSQAIEESREKECNDYHDKDTFIVANLERINEELEGDSKYLRSSIADYAESFACTNQVAGGKTGF
jgi:hypothetical protein